jgi:hypothetical protein
MALSLGLVSSYRGVHRKKEIVDQGTLENTMLSREQIRIGESRGIQ